jgi:hypothetical protein
MVHTGRLHRSILTRILHSCKTFRIGTTPLPSFAATVLTERRQRPYIGEQQVIFASSSGTLRRPRQLRHRLARPA